MVLAAFLGKRGSYTLPAPSWQWSWTERQRFLVLHLGQSKWRMITDIYQLEVGSLCRSISKWCSRDSLMDNHNLIHFRGCNWVILSVLAYKTGQNFVYRLWRPHRTLINHDARQKVVDAPLTLILPWAYPQYAIIHFRIEYQQWSCGSRCILFMHILLDHYIVL